MLVQQRKSLTLTLVKQKRNFAWACITMVTIVICLLMRKKSYKFKADNKNLNFLTQFSLGSISEKFDNYHLNEMFMILQSIVMLLIKQTYL